jgi:hypothetical protein
MTSAKLAVQRDGFGYFAEISISIQFARPLTEDVSVEFMTAIPKRYRVAAEFGFEYAWEHTPRSKKIQGALQICVNQLRTQVVDTSAVLVAYVAADALWKALDELPGRPLNLDLQGGGVFFPR